MCQALRELMAEEIQEELRNAEKRALEKGALLSLFQLVKKNIISPETAANEVNLPLEEFIEKMKNYEALQN